MEELEQLAKERFEVIRDCYGKVIKEFEKLCDELSSGNQQKLKQIAFDKSADQIKDSLKLKEDAVMKNWYSNTMIFNVDAVAGNISGKRLRHTFYNEDHTSGLRFPWDIPVEDFLFGWALVTAVLLLWVFKKLRWY